MEYRLETHKIQSKGQGTLKRPYALKLWEYGNAGTGPVRKPGGAVISGTLEVHLACHSLDLIIDTSFLYGYCPFLLLPFSI